LVDVARPTANRRRKGGTNEKRMTMNKMKMQRLGAALQIIQPKM
jgi:hypothetical protein